MTATTTDRGPAGAALAAAVAPRRRRRRTPEAVDRGIISDLERRSGRGAWTIRSLVAATIACLSLISAGPLLWMIKASLSTTQEINSAPFGFPAELQWENYATAWRQAGIARYTWNSVVVAGGSVVSALLVAVLAAYVIAILRPRYAGVVEGAIMVTLFLPSVISLVPLYLTIIDLGLLDTYWAVWLPAGAHAFNVMLVLQYMRGLPGEVFEAARVDGAGPVRALLLIALPMSRPIIGSVALLSFVASWKDFLWPLLALPSPDKQPLSVALSIVAPLTDRAVLMAAMVIAVAIPIAIFFVFQRQFLAAAGASGAVKG